MENNQNLSEQFKKEIEAISNDTILNSSYRKNKLILWIIRTVISVILYILFWSYTWVKWTLLLTIPLNLFSLFTIIGLPYLLKRKIKRAEQKISIVDQLTSETNHNKE